MGPTLKDETDHGKKGSCLIGLHTSPAEVVGDIDFVSLRHVQSGLSSAGSGRQISGKIAWVFLLHLAMSIRMSPSSNSGRQRHCRKTSQGTAINKKSQVAQASAHTDDTSPYLSFLFLAGWLAVDELPVPAIMLNRSPPMGTVLLLLLLALVGLLNPLLA